MRASIIGLGFIAGVAHGADWPAYGGGPGGGHYTTATQIDPGNVASLQVAWVHRSGDFHEGIRPGVEGFDTEARAASGFIGTPIVVNDTLYYCTPYNRAVALDPATGEERWVFDPGVDIAAEGLTNCRGLSAWSDPDGDGACRHRVYLPTMDGRMIALDGATGEPCADFGDDGTVDLTHGLTEFEQTEFAISSPPAILNQVLVTGSRVIDSLRKDVPAGVVRAYDLRTGEFRWGWNPVAPGESPVDDDGNYVPGTTNVWSIISADRTRNLVIVPTGNSSPDYYGGDRGGTLDYYSSSVVALDGATGEVVWHFQTVHHDIWDFDVPSQPTLVDLTIGGKTRPAVVQVTKMGLTFVLDLETGEPLHPVEERPVPQEGAVPGEYLSPTQPFPTKPVPLHQLTVGPEDAWGFTFWDAGACRDALEAAGTGPIYTPLMLGPNVLYPSNIGGQNWGAPAVDLERKLLITNTKHVPMLVELRPRESCDGTEGFPQRDSPYCVAMRPFTSPLGAPCTKPPWSTLDAVDLETGELVWRVPFGTLKHHPGVFWPFSIMKGGVEMGGPLVTKSGLVFIGAAGDRGFRAFDATTGAELWHDELPTTANSVPASYESGGRQFVVTTAGGHFTSTSPAGDWVIAYALPTEGE